MFRIPGKRLRTLLDTDKIGLEFIDRIKETRYCMIFRSAGLFEKKIENPFEDRE